MSNLKKSHPKLERKNAIGPAGFCQKGCGQKKANASVRLNVMYVEVVINHDINQNVKKLL